MTEPPLYVMSLDEQLAYLGMAQRKCEGSQVNYECWPFNEVALGYRVTRQAIEDSFYRSLAAPHVWIPKPLAVVATGMAAAVVTNPAVTRRFWQGWRTK
jgi:hypothetical protein